jgi:hypothetical protein
MHLGREGANDAGRLLLMTGVGIGEEKAHRDRVDTGAHKLAHRGGDVRALQRLDHLAGRVEPFADLEDAIAREQHRRRRSEDVEDVLAAPLPPDLVDIAKAARGEESHARAVAFDERVERHG